MSTHGSGRIIHSYDTEQHRVLCGRPEQADSTKHSRGVTCVTCLGLLSPSQAEPGLVEAPSLGE